MQIMTFSGLQRIWLVEQDSIWWWWTICYRLLVCEIIVFICKDITRDFLKFPMTSTSSFQDKFVMFDVSSNRFLLSISCGGGHRTWDFDVDKMRSTFAFIKKRQIILHQNSFRIQKSLIKVRLVLFSIQEFLFEMW